MSLFDINKNETVINKDGSKTVTRYHHRDWPWQDKKVLQVTRYNAAGEQDGDQELYLTSPTISPYKNGVQEGVEKEYDKNKKLLRQTPYINGKKKGVETQHFSDGSVKMEVDYIDGDFHTCFKTYFRNGQLESCGSSKRTESEHTNRSYSVGEYTRYTEEGAIISKKIFTQDGEPVSEEYYQADGVKLDRQTIYQRGRKVTHRKYHPNGKLSEERNFLGNQPHGLYVAFDENQGLEELEYSMYGQKLSEDDMTAIAQLSKLAAPAPVVV